ncbi:MAG: methyl-accepting chemotaxis protein [Acidobacteriota bacterium]
MSQWSIRKQLFSAFFAMAAVFAVFGWNALNAAKGLTSQVVTIVDADAPAIVSAARVQYLAMRLSSSADMIVVAGFNKDRAGVDREWASIEQTYTEFEAKAALLASKTNLDANRRRSRDLLAAMSQWKTLAQQAAEHARAFRVADANSAMVASEKFSDDIAEALTAEMLKAETDNLDHARKQSDDSMAATGRVQIALILLVGLISLGVAYILHTVDVKLRGVSLELREGAHQVALASGAMSSFSQSLAIGSQQQAAALQQTSASMEEMSGVTRLNADRCHTAAGQMAETERRVADAGRALNDLVSSMTEIRDSSVQVTKIIKTIDEIAFQTNILALNAAVEAARAGEAGMGFAVVADEVRNLAQRSSEAARDTAELISASAESAQRGGKRVAAVETAISSITESSGQVKTLIDQVADASVSQASGIVGVRRAVQQMETVTQATAAKSETSAAASEELNAQAEQTLDTLQTLEAMAGIRGATVAAAHPAAAAPRATLRKAA